MIYLHTGAPGAGKTLSAVEFIEKILQERPDRVVYSNINGIRLDGVIAVDNDWCANWWDRATPGSVIVIDEAQNIWRSTRGGGEPPRAVTDLETHRHDGIDIVMITQHPTLVHSNIRKLVTRHVHVVEYTKTTSLRWEWRECHDDVQDKALRLAGEFKEWRLPSRLFDVYTSAADHTRRTKRPKAQIKGRIMLGLSGALVLAMVVAAFHYVPRLLDGAKVFTQSPVAGAKAHAPISLGGSVPDARGVPVTAAQYVARQMPRVASQPWSAPIYDGQTPTQHPQVWCIAPADPAGPDCRCITEQGTRYEVEQGLCRKMAQEGGTYDPYRRERKEDSRPVAAPESPSAADPGRVVLAGIPAPTRQPVGVGPAAYVPPQYGDWNADAFGK